MPHFRLMFNGPTDLAPMNALRLRILQIHEMNNCDSLTVVFSSGGGSTTEALNFADFLRSLAKPITFHGAGSVSSAAVPVFMSAKGRTCTPSCRFLFHAFNWGFGNGAAAVNQIREALAVLAADRDRARAIVGSNSKIPAAKLDELYSELADATIVDSEQAKKWAMVSDVLELNPSGQAQDNVAIWTVVWT